MSVISLDPYLEQEYIKKAKKDRTAFSHLYEHYKKPIETFIRFRVTGEDTTQDLTSVVFQKAIEGLDSFKWQGISFSAWLYRIARNTVIDYYRTQKNQKKTISIDGTSAYGDPVSPEKTPDEVLMDSYFEDKIKTLLNGLPEKERKIIYMKFFEGYTNKTIANLSNLSETNVSTIVCRTLLKLRENFESD